jgi:hypothetical protein
MIGIDLIDRQMCSILDTLAIARVFARDRQLCRYLDRG